MFEEGGIFRLWGGEAKITLFFQVTLVGLLCPSSCALVSSLRRRFFTAFTLCFGCFVAHWCSFERLHRRCGLRAWHPVIIFSLPRYYLVCTGELREVVDALFFVVGVI